MGKGDGWLRKAGTLLKVKGGRGGEEETSPPRGFRGWKKSGAVSK